MSQLCEDAGGAGSNFLENAMSRIAVPTREAAPVASQPLLDAVEKQLGVVPNLFRLIALSPAALQGFLGLNGALGKALDLKTRERIAIRRSPGQWLRLLPLST